jgi:chemotaxis protein CheC
MGNIGSIQAAIALSKMFPSQVEISVLEVDVVPIGKIESLVGGAETIVAGIHLQSLEVRGKILLIFPKDDAQSIVDILMGTGAGHAELLTDIALSVLGEVGNILSYSYFNQFSKILGITLTVSEPNVFFGSVRSIANFISGLDQRMKYTLRIETKIIAPAADLKARFFLFIILDPESLDAILDALEEILVAEKAETRACPSCGNEVGEGARFCSMCGKKLY